MIRGECGREGGLSRHFPCTLPQSGGHGAHNPREDSHENRTSQHRHRRYEVDAAALGYSDGLLALASPDHKASIFDAITKSLRDKP